jgi:opacity protein-like surface antigen
MALVALVVAGGFPDGLRAESNDTHRNYVQIRLGANEFTEDMDDADFDTGAIVGGRFGRYLNRYLVAEVGVDFFAAERDFDGYSGATGYYDREDSLGVFGVLATLKGEFPVGPVRIFGGGGVGYYFVTVSSEMDTQTMGDFDTDDGDSVFGLHAEVGATYDINPRFFVGLQGMYRWTDDVDLHETEGPLVIDYEDDLIGYTVTLSAGFRF